MGSATARAASTGEVPAYDAATLARLARAENFPVALRVLPARVRRDLHAVYALARLIDDVGDDAAVPVERRLALLDGLDADLHALAEGRPVSTDAVAALRGPVAAGRLRVEPFLDLVAANRQDQTVLRYRTYDDLRTYCALSANPVGRLVLGVFGVTDERAAALSDDVCTALQILEHCQDVAEDKRDHDRVYLPQEDLHRFGVRDADLDGAQADAGVRGLVGFEVDRAVHLLASGTRLVAMLHGWAGVAIGGYVAGGLATADALRRAGHDVLATTPRPRRRDVARHLLRLVAVRR